MGNSDPIPDHMHEDRVTFGKSDNSNSEEGQLRVWEMLVDGYGFTARRVLIELSHDYEGSKPVYISAEFCCSKIRLLPLVGEKTRFTFRTEGIDLNLRGAVSGVNQIRYGQPNWYSINLEVE